MRFLVDRATFLTAFGTLFLAEMGDKTQLAVITLTASSKRPLSVFLGAVSALAAVTALGVVFGESATKLLPGGAIHKIVATAFIGVGVWMWAHP